MQAVREGKKIVSFQFHAILKMSPKLSCSIEDRLLYYYCGSGLQHSEAKSSRAVISDPIRKLARFAYMTDDLERKAGAKVAVRTEELIDAGELSTPTRKLASQLDISRSTVANIFIRYESI